MKKTLKLLDSWIEEERFLGWDPHDALNSPLLHFLTFNNRRLGQVWVQLLKRSPVNFRPLLGVPKGFNPKGMGLSLTTYARRYGQLGDPKDLEKALFFADWLEENVTTGFHGNCWGYNFDWPNRGFFAPKGSPTVVNTVFISLGFLALDDALQMRGKSSARGLNAAKSACQFILHDLQRYNEVDDELCFSYTPLDSRWVHNASVLGGQLLSEVASRTGNEEMKAIARKVARFTVRRQRSDGSWSYGTAARDAWADNFHTGFVLNSLKKISENLDTNEFDAEIYKGYAFWKEHFFLTDGTPKYLFDRVYPIDSHSVAQAILTFLAFCDHDPESINWASLVANWGLMHMQDQAGYFYYQTHRRYINKIPYMRWSQAWMQYALTVLSFHKEGE
jgi:hypothetical protein